MSDFLDRMRRSSIERVQAARAQEAFEDLWDRALDAPEPAALALNGFDLIAEVKAASPSEGPLSNAAAADLPAVLTAQAQAYVRAGAAAISVLTEPSAFGGSLEHLKAIAAATDVPVMRKDFLVADYQVVEARANGASGVLLIVRMLEDEDLFEMIDLTLDLNMFCLVEAFDEADVQRLSRLMIMRGGEFVQDGGDLLLGLNCRDLATLKIDRTRLASYRPLFPSGRRLVAESGLATVEDAGWVAELGYDLALVGTALMKAEDPAALAAGMIDAGRRSRP